MLTRRHIRIKVMQTIYALYKAEQLDIDTQEKFLFNSIKDMYNLYLTLMNLVMEIWKMAEHQLQISQKKYLATQEEKTPNRTFVDNKVLKIMATNMTLQDEIRKNSDSDWEMNNEYVKIIYKHIINSELYHNYMVNTETSFDQDKAFLGAIYKEYIAQNDKLYDHIEDHKLTWIDDFPVVNMLILKAFKKMRYQMNDRYFIIDLYKDKDDQLFSSELFRKTIVNDQLLQDEIKGKTPNWDIDRIAMVDSILIKMAICEFLKFPTIPVKVTINEYLEIAKEYSTPKSSVFINGVLDKLVREYSTSKELNKVGRGLL